MYQPHIKVIVGSCNPVKVNAALAAFRQLFPDDKVECTGIPAPSGVADQPMTSEATRQGAENRVKHCKAQVEADFYVAMEGGVDFFEYGPATFAYVAIADENYFSIGRSAQLPLPRKVYQGLLDGEELGHIMDRLFDTTNVKQHGGAIGLLTNDAETRESAYRQALILTMAPFLHRELF